MNNTFAGKARLLQTQLLGLSVPYVSFRRHPADRSNLTRWM
jgi:hypothetical protein